MESASPFRGQRVGPLRETRPETRPGLTPRPPPAWHLPQHHRNGTAGDPGSTVLVDYVPDHAAADQRPVMLAV